jgi:hypothetical protein
MALLRPLLIALFLPLAATAVAVDARVVDAARTTPPELPATVTQDMGDVGGKFFGQPPDPAKTRHYYIAVEPDLWSFAPEGQDPVCGKPFPTPLLLNRLSWKMRYVQYADPEFSARVLPTERLGILGPVLRGTTGEYLAVTVLNRGWQPVSMHPHGLLYDKDSEGSYYKPNPGLGASIAPGARFTYVWYLDEDSGPRPEEPSSKAWLYHSHVGGDGDINLGLFGCIIVTDAARARTDGTPRDADREMAAVFNIFDESGVPDEDNDSDVVEVLGRTAPVKLSWAQTQQALEEGERHTINGRTFGNLAGLEMNQGERVRWYLFGLGSEKDFHTAHWHGQRVTEDNRRRTDVVELLPAAMKVADMQASNPGSWLLHCHVADHMENGMFAKFVVHPTGSPGASRDPSAAFLGAHDAVQTLHFQSADLTLAPDHPETCELDLSGQVTVPDPYPMAGKPFIVQIGARKIEFRPDASGIFAGPEGILLVKNAATYGNAPVKGALLAFDLTLKGPALHAELEKAHLLEKGSLAPHATLPIELYVGPAHHSGSATLKIAAPESDAKR